MPKMPENMPRVGAVVLLRDDGAALLQLRDAKPSLRNAGLWVPPGGHAEPGEAIEACARREFYEETDYRCGQLHWLCTFEDRVEGFPPYALTVFWSRYDGQQRVACREGQALEFVRREEAGGRAMPPYLKQLWNDAYAQAFKLN